MKKSKTIRQNLFLPADVERYGELSSLDAWFRQLWGKPTISDNGCGFHLLRTYSSLVVDSAIPHPAAIDAMVALLKDDQPSPNSVSISAQRYENSSRRTILGLNQRTRLAVYCWLDDERQSEINYTAVRPKRLATNIVRRLRSEFDDSKVRIGTGPKLQFRDINSLGIVLALHSGADPYLVQAISGAIRPISQGIDDPYQLVGLSGEAHAHLLESHSGLSLRSEKLHVNAELYEETAEAPSEWVADAIKLLRDMCKELNAAISRRVNSPNKKAMAIEIIERFQSRAEAMGPRDSAVALAVKYSRKRFVDGGTISAGTLRQYLERAVITGLLDSENAYSLGDWEADDFVENLENRISSPKLMARSKRTIIDAYRPLIRFLVKELNIAPVSFSSIESEFVGGAGQWRLLSPHAIDKVIGTLAKCESRNIRQCAIVIALGFYGGLRATEIRRLTLADIVFNKTFRNVDVECLRGKSRNSRRRLPFHQLAPKRIVKLLRRHCTARRQEFRNDSRLASIALLGPVKARNGYQYDSIVRLTRQLLKQAFGESINIHLLRHCFCSSLFLRWYAIRYPDILVTLRDRSHSLYQPYMQKQLNDYFNCMPVEDGDIRPYDLISIIKLTGHASPATLFQYYIHSYSVVQMHAVTRMNSTGLQERLADTVIRTLIPRMRSSKSRSKLRSRTIAGIASFVFKKDQVRQSAGGHQEY